MAGAGGMIDFSGVHVASWRYALFVWSLGYLIPWYTSQVYTKHSLQYDDIRDRYWYVRMLYPIYNIQIFVNTVHHCFFYFPHLNKTQPLYHLSSGPTDRYPSCTKMSPIPKTKKTAAPPWIKWGTVNQPKKEREAWEMENWFMRKVVKASWMWFQRLEKLEFLPSLFLGGKMAENGSIDPLEPILGILIVGDLNFTWLFLDEGQQNCGKGGEH